MNTHATLGLLFSLTVSLTPHAYGAATAERIGTVWPLCPGWKTELESWQWITPSELTADRAIAALESLRAFEGKHVEAESAMTFDMDEQLVEGYRLLVMAKQDVTGFPEDSAGAVNHRESVRTFCQWITTNAFPE